MSTKLPRLLNAMLNEKARLQPTAMSVTLELEGVSTASMTLTESDAAVDMHDLVEVYTPRGSAGIFRVTNIEDTKRQQRAVTLMHAIDTLSDSVWHGQTDYSGTVAGFLAALLAEQPVTRWQLGTCEDTGAWKKSGINYDRLSDLLEEVRSNRFGYHFTYDFSTNPWTLNFVANANTVTSEFRLARNVETCRVTKLDGEQCNRLFLSINQKKKEHGVTVTDTTYKTYNNTSSQQVYGIIEKTADIDLEDVPNADTWAADFLAQRAQPMVQISIDAYALRQITGLEWDEAKLGEVARVALPDYAEALDERVVTINYPELLFGDGVERVTVELANHLAKFSETIATVQKRARSAGRAAKKAGRGGASAAEMEQWSIVVAHHGDVLDGSGVTELYESGIELNAQSGVKIYTLAQGFVSQYAAIGVNRDAITSEVSRATAAEGAMSSLIEQNADSIALKVSKGDVATQLTVEMGNVSISGGNLRVSGYVTASSFDGLEARFDNLVAGRTTATKLLANTVSANTSLVLGSQGSLTMWSTSWSAKSQTVVTSVSITKPSISVSASADFATVNSRGEVNGAKTGRLITSYDMGSSSISTKTLHYVGY